MLNKPVLTILCVADGVVAFAITYNTIQKQYLLAVHPNPSLYTIEGTPLLVVNLDNWLQAETHQRYSLRGVLDMAAGFVSGYQAAYTHANVGWMLQQAITKVHYELFCTDLVRLTIARYSVELCGTNALDQLIADIREHWDAYLKRMGEDGLSAYLNRCLQHCHNIAPLKAAVFERFQARLACDAVHIDHTTDPEIDSELFRRVIPDLISFPNVPDTIREAIRTLHTDL